ncbi:MAG: hypothetical protein CTY12_04630 [Methylotenera sp.]|nr:MAG: hypothetical protein CTY12_04630 [Methylotenera sp.]
MVGMLQIITYLLAFYLVLKGIEILYIALASNNDKRGGMVFFGIVVLMICIFAAASFIKIQDEQAESVSAKANTEIN